MPTENTLFTKEFMWLARCLLFLLVASICPGYLSAKVTISASKDCPFGPPNCTVVDPGPFTTVVAQMITWSASYTGTPGPGNPQAFWISSSGSNMADTRLNTSNGQLGGTYFLPAGTYYISIRTGNMGTGSYSLTYSPNANGEPHLTTMNGMHYDFQSVGEFVFLRNSGMEVQTRQGPIPTTYNPGADPHDDLATCVSINTAVAARVGKHRVSYQPNLSGVPDPSGLQLRVDGVLTMLGPGGINLVDGGRISRTMAPGGLEIDFPDGSNLLITPNWWDFLKIWYIDVDVVPTHDAAGIAGSFAQAPKDARSTEWLPALPDGSSMGSMPAPLHDRFVALYQKFTDAWRVTSANSLFDYAPGTSTDTFTMKTWPPEHPACSLPGKISVAPLPEAVAKQICESVIADNAHCVFDVTVTGNAGFVTTYLLRQGLLPNPGTTTPAKPGDQRLVWILGILLLLTLILLIICWLRR
jgi:hypothetical protein